MSVFQILLGCLVSLALTTGCAAQLARVAPTSQPTTATAETTAAAPLAAADLPQIIVTVPGLATTTAETIATSTEPVPETTGEPPLTLDGCKNCRDVLATTAVGELTAALVSTKKGAALVAVHDDGSTSKPLALKHGTEFGAPPDGRLPCDDAGRCLVLAAQDDGTAIASAYQLDPGGTWTDLSGPNAFPSATDKAAIIEVDDHPAIAVQESGAGRTGWIVLAWSGERYTVVGCATDSDSAPTAADLSTEACLS